MTPVLRGKRHLFGMDPVSCTRTRTRDRNVFVVSDPFPSLVRSTTSVPSSVPLNLVCVRMKVVRNCRVS